MKPVVFLGPSLPRAEAAALLDADYLPPAAAGDVYTASRRRPPAIVLIDGYFERVPAVWHKEVLHALASGIAVYGAASMGALRAAELHGFGMVGVGSIFARFRDGELEDDDEVAVRHVDASFDYRPVSEAMVNLRDGLAAATQAGLLDAEEAARLVMIAKAMFYPTRSWPALVRAGVAAGLDATRLASLLAWAEAHRPNTKRDDARAVLTRVAADLAAPRAPSNVCFEFERSIFWDKLVESLGGTTTDDLDGARATAVADWAKLRDAGARWQAATNRHLLALEARRREWQVSPERGAAAVDEFRRARGLEQGEDFAAWLAARHLDAETLARLAQHELLRAEFEVTEAPAIELALLDELKSDAAWPALVAEGARQEAAARALGRPAPLPAEAGFTEAEVLAWYEAHFRPLGGDLARHARSLGFASTTAFLVAVTRARLAAEA
ncbi:MAG: TfuA-like protein [Gammaproteobacteria bacterium]